MLPHPQLALKVTKLLAEEAKRLKQTLKGRFYFAPRKIASRIGENANARKIGAILHRLKELKAINYDKTFKKYFIEANNITALKEMLNKLSNTYLLEYYKPLNHIEPPILVINIKENSGKMVAQAKREGILKPVYIVKGEAEFKIIFKQFRQSGFIIKKNGEQIFRAKRSGICSPLQGEYNGEKFQIKRIKGREIRLTFKNGKKVAATLKSCGFEKAIFSYEKEVEEIAVPLAIAMFAIKQLDVII